MGNNAAVGSLLHLNDSSLFPPPPSPVLAPGRDPRVKPSSPEALCSLYSSPRPVCWQQAPVVQASCATWLPVPSCPSLPVPPCCTSLPVPPCPSIPVPPCRPSLPVPPCHPASVPHTCSPACPGPRERTARKSRCSLLYCHRLAKRLDAVPTSACLHQTYQTPQPDSQIL